MERAGGFGSRGFESLAVVARRNIALFEVAPHVGPVVCRAKGHVHFIGTEMAEGVVSKAGRMFREGC